MNRLGQNTKDTGNDHTGEKQKRTTRDEKRDGRSKGSQRKKAAIRKIAIKEGLKQTLNFNFAAEKYSGED